MEEGREGEGWWRREEGEGGVVVSMLEGRPMLATKLVV